MAGERGFEPLKAEPESAVIPLHHSPKFNDLNQQVVYINCPVWSIWTKGQGIWLRDKGAKTKK